MLNVPSFDDAITLSRHAMLR